MSPKPPTTRALESPTGAALKQIGALAARNFVRVNDPRMPMLSLPWSCVLHDNHRFIPSRGRLVASSKYRTAKRAAESIMVLQWRRQQLSGDLALHARCFFPDQRKRDAGNYRKLITDCLTGIAYTDDSQLVSETWERAGFDKANPRIEITLRST